MNTHARPATTNVPVTTAAMRRAECARSERSGSARGSIPPGNTPAIRSLTLPEDLASGASPSGLRQTLKRALLARAGVPLPVRDRARELRLQHVAAQRRVGEGEHVVAGRVVIPVDPQVVTELQRR